MKKKILIAAIIVVLLILLFPIRLQLKDGGSVEYKALLYTVTRYHRLAPTETESGYIDGIGIEILGVEIFNNTDKRAESYEETVERNKIKDAKFTNVENTNINKLAKFNNILYGESYVVIDYAGDLNKSIGKIDYLIGEEYVPQINGETNCKELLNSFVLEANDKNMVLNVNNVAVLYNAIKENYNINTTLPYIPDGMDVADPNDESNIPADEIEYNRDVKNVKNVTIEVIKDTITNKSVEILITDNNKDYYGWGVDFKVQKKVNGEWKDLKYASDDLVWNSIAYIPNEDNQLKQKLDIEEYYGKLSKGTYRVVKTVYDNGYIDIYSNEFEIK